MSTKYVVQMNGQDFARLDTRDKAEKYVAMQVAKKKGGTERSSNPSPAFAATQKWSIVERS